MVDEANYAEMSASSGDKIGGRGRGSIGIFFRYIHSYREHHSETNINDCLY